MSKTIMGASIGNCVHVAGVSHFLALAEEEGYNTIFLGPAVSVETLFENIAKSRPSMVAISYRLTPQVVRSLLDEVAAQRETLPYNPLWLFGGTGPVAKIAQEYSFFSYISTGEDDINDSIRFLRGEESETAVDSYGQTLKERVLQNYPYPILRHHFGLPSLEQTIQGIEDIAQAKVLDVISLGPDQNAQQFFFRPEQMQAKFDGAGGVPVRTASDLRALKAASQRGNYPLMRCYSGTEDVFAYGSLLLETIDNAWAAIPLCWYNELDGRGSRTLEQSVVEAQQLIGWHASQEIPVEINEPHHWSLRDAHDVIPVAMAYISAYNAKKLGVKHYIGQYMFNNPSGLSFPMDLARALAMVEMVESLADENFITYRQTRAGLPLFAADEDVARGQLAATTFLQMALRPHIVHVVASCEANHAALAADVIASCKIVKGVIRHTLSQPFSIENDERIKARKEELIREAGVLLDFLQNRFSSYSDPLANPEVLAESIKRGYLDAVHILKNQKFRGKLTTRLHEGMWVAYDTKNNRAVSEAERLNALVAEEVREENLSGTG